MIKVAALYVETGGAYFDIPHVDPWDKERDARNYAGPWPVVAHPPCARWSILAPLNESKHGLKVGDDGGCFKAALLAVIKFGGVLEHPERSFAWGAFNMPKPPASNGWQRSLLDPDQWVCEVWQSAYGHPAGKKTWLFYAGKNPPAALNWAKPRGKMVINQAPGRREMPKRLRAFTPPAFRAALVGLAINSRH